MKRYVTTNDFEEMLNDVYEPVTVCGFEYSAGTALRAIDPIAFATGYHDWVDGLITDDQVIEDDNGEFVWNN